MSTTFGAKKIEEFRGVSDFVIAPMLTDTADGMTYGEVIPLAGIQELTKEVETSQETHYYDNVAALVISGEGADNYTVKVSALDLQRLSLISGRHYDADKDMMVETERKLQYFAVGYKTGLTGDVERGDYDRYVWKYKCQFDMPGDSAKTKDNSATAEGQELKLVSIFTNYREEIDGKMKPLKGLVVAEGKADLSTFFTAVTKPSEVTVKAASGGNTDQTGDQTENPAG